MQGDTTEALIVDLFTTPLRKVGVQAETIWSAPK